MRSYILRRLLQTVIVILLLSLFYLFIMSWMPGDPVDLMITSNPNVKTEDIVRLKKLYGLDQPVYQRYFHWFSDILSGDFGYSRTYKVPVEEILGPRLLNTFYPSLSSLYFFAISLAIPIGVIAALKKNTIIDYGINLFAFAGISLPSFFLGILLIILFAVKLRWLPAGGTNTIKMETVSSWGSLTDRLSYLILPVITLTVLQTAVFIRYTRSSMIEVMNLDYIRTARAKGLSRGRIILVHALRNALIPVVTIIALSFSSLFSGAIITETLFSYQGVGKLVYDSILGNDYNVAMVSFMISVSMVLLMNLLADILYAWLDPRISYV